MNAQSFNSDTLEDNSDIIGFNSDNLKNYTRLSIPGCPIPKARARFFRCGGSVRVYDPQNADKQSFREVLRDAFGHPPLEGPISLSIVCVFKTPKCHLFKESFFHVVKPDVDNLIKWVGDVGNGILWRDDKQIVSIAATKLYSVEPRTQIAFGEIIRTVVI